MGFTAAVLQSLVGLRAVRRLFELEQLAHHPEARRAVQHCCCEAHAQLRQLACKGRFVL